MKVGKFLFQSGNFLKMTYLKNVKVIYQCTVEIKKKIGIESALEKEIFPPPQCYFFKKICIFRENCKKSFFGSMIIFEKAAYCDKN